MLRNGNAICLTRDFGPVETDILGNTVRQWHAHGRPQVVLDDAVSGEACAVDVPAARKR